MSRKYSKELKEQILNEICNGRSVRALAEDYEPHEMTIRNWVLKHQMSHSLGQDSTDEEIKQLRRENRRLQKDNAILKK